MPPPRARRDRRAARVHADARRLAVVGTAPGPAPDLGRRPGRWPGLGRIRGLLPGRARGRPPRRGRRRRGTRPGRGRGMKHRGLKKRRLKAVASGDLAEAIRRLDEYRKQLTVVATGLDRLARARALCKTRLV